MARGDVIKRINEETDIVALVQEFVKLDKKGKNYMGLCPFHAEKSPSFSVSPEKKIAMCMGCKQGGNVLTFYQQIKNISTGQAIQELAGRLGIENELEPVKKDPNEHLYQIMNDAKIFYEFVLHNTEYGKEALDYLSKRELSMDEITHFGIGVSPQKDRDALYKMLSSKGYQVSDMIDLGLVKQADDGTYYDLFQSRLMFSITNPEGKVVGFSGRTLNPKDNIKYVNSPETKIFKKGELLYHFYEGKRSINQHKQVILHEGFFDVIASYKAGMNHVVATMGTALTSKQAKLLKSATDSVIVAYDGDKAGLSSMMSAAPLLQKEKLKLEFLMFPEKMDPDEFIKAYGMESYENLYGEHLLDYYQFAYRFYSLGKDFKDANDVNQFKYDMQVLLKNAQPTIQSYYQKLTLEKLGISLDVSKSNPLPPSVQVVEHKVFKPKISKYEASELMLIIHLLLTNEHFDYISENLKATALSKIEHYTIYVSIIKFYSTYPNSKINIHHFLELYPENRLFIEEKILNDMHFCNRLSLKIDSINGYLNNIAEVDTKHQLDDLYDQLKKMDKENEKEEIKLIGNKIILLTSKLKRGVKHGN